MATHRPALHSVLSAQRTFGPSHVIPSSAMVTQVLALPPSAIAQSSPDLQDTEEHDSPAEGFGTH